MYVVFFETHRSAVTCIRLMWTSCLEFDVVDFENVLESLTSGWFKNDTAWATFTPDSHHDVPSVWTSFNSDVVYSNISGRPILRWITSCWSLDVSHIGQITRLDGSIVTHLCCNYHTLHLSVTGLRHGRIVIFLCKQFAILIAVSTHELLSHRQNYRVGCVSMSWLLLSILSTGHPLVLWVLPLNIPLRCIGDEPSACRE